MTLATQFAKESYTVDYAGFWLRLGAMAIDSVILAFLVWMLAGGYPIIFGRGWMGAASSDDAGVIYWFFLLLIPVLMSAAYFIGFWRWRGQTPGKLALQITVVRFNGDLVSWGGAVMRFLGYIISIAPLFIGFLWVAYDLRRQGWHDKLAETYVVRNQSR